MRRTFFILTVIVSLIYSCGPSTQKEANTTIEESTEVSQFLDSWPREDPELLWKYEGLGRGYGGPLVTRDGIYINGEEDGNSFTCCLDLEGNLLWKSPNGKTFTGVDFSASYPGTRSIPSMMGSYVYAISGMGHLSCFHKNTGNVIWSVDLVKDFQGKPGDFGYSATPVVDEDKVYCFTGGIENNLVALDRNTGKLVWSSPLMRDYFSYDTPILVDLAERKVLAGVSRNYVYVASRQDGVLLSFYQLEDIREGYEHCNSIVWEMGEIYFVTYSEQGQGSLKLKLSDDGKILMEIWRNDEIKNIFGGFVLNDSYMYTTLENKKLVVLDREKGTIRNTIRAESGSIVLSDNRLLIYGHNGKIQFFILNNGMPELQSEMRITRGDGHHFSFPVISDGRMYIRRGNTLMAFSLDN